MAKKKNNDSTQSGEEIMKSVQEFFSEPEISEKAQLLAKSLQEVDDIKAEQKASADVFKSKLKAKETEISKLKDAINMGYEMVLRPCKMVKNFEKLQREYYLDNKLVHTEVFTAEDHQIKIDENAD